MTVPDGPTSTPIWGLEKVGGEEKVNVLEAFHRNFDKIDKMGRFQCTSTTRPTTGLFDGLVIYETDTRQQWSYVAGAPGGWAFDGPGYVEFTFAASVANNSVQNIGAFAVVAGTAKGKQFYSSPSAGRLTIINTTPRSQFYSIVAETSSDGPCGARSFFEVTNSIVSRVRILDPEQTAQLSIAGFVVDPNVTRSFDFNLFQNVGVVRGFTGIIRLSKLADA
jgi:hypothetical protein